jgi:NACHT/LRR/PYD domain-containing protein 3
MNKLQGPRESDHDYELVVLKIQEFLVDIRKGTPLERADSWIRKEYYTEERTNITRLSGESRSTEDCYINLALIGQYDVQAGHQRNSLGGLGPKSSPFALHD